MGKIKEIVLKIWDVIKKFFKKLKDFFSKLFKKLKEKQIHIKIKNGFIKLVSLIGTGIGKITKRNIDTKKELEKAHKIKDNIEKNIDNETDITVIKLYKKQTIKTIKRFDKINKVEDREEKKEIKNIKKEFAKLQEKIIKREDKLNDKVSILDVKKDNQEEIVEEPIIKKEPVKEERKKSELPKKTGKAIKNTSIKVGSVIKKGSIKTAKAIGGVSKKTGLLIATTIGTAISNISKKAKVKKLKQQEYRNLKNSIKEINLKINRAYKEISKVNNSYSDTKLQELLFIKEKVLDLKEDYIRLRGAKNFKTLKNDKNIYSVDPNHLVHHGNAIYDLIDYLELSINEVKDGRTHVEPKYPKEEKKEVKEVKAKTITFEANDFVLVKDCIEKDITSALNEVVKIKNEMNDIPLKYKKSTVLSRTYTFFKYSMNTAISLIPFGIFKNKFVATLTSGIILNNRIKAMRSLIYDKRVEFIEYESIINNISDKYTCLEKTSYVLLDTVKQIDDVNTKLTEEYPNKEEALKLIKKLEEMKIDLLEENQKIETLLEETDQKIKIKQKNKM